MNRLLAALHITETPEQKENRNLQAVLKAEAEVMKELSREAFDQKNAQESKGTLTISELDHILRVNEKSQRQVDKPEEDRQKMLPLDGDPFVVVPDSGIPEALSPKVSLLRTLANGVADFVHQSSERLEKSWNSYADVLTAYELETSPSVEVLSALRELMDLETHPLFSLAENLSGETKGVSNAQILRALVEAGINIKLEDEEGTVIHHIAMNINKQNLEQSMELSLFLVESGIDVNEMNVNNNYSVAHFAAEKPLQYLQSLVKKTEINLSEVGGGGMTPLHAAALSGKVEMIRYLLSQGVRKDLMDDNKKTPLDLAQNFSFEESKKAQMIELLKD